MQIGYARVSTKQQDLTRQIKALEARNCDRIFSDKVTGKSLAGRPEMELALAAIREGDTFIVAEWDRATRSMWDGLQIIKRIIDAKSKVIVLDRPYIDLETPMGQGFLAMMSAMAEDERLRILKRTNEGRIIALARGVKFGPKPKLSQHQRKLVLDRKAAGDMVRDIARDMGVHHSTISRLQ
jgi:DNA invertase Pin-like site-specific DNA recombinase